MTQPKTFLSNCTFWNLGFLVCRKFYSTVLRNRVFQNYSWWTVWARVTHSFWWCVFCDCFFAGCKCIDSALSEIFWCRKNFFVKFIILVNEQIHIFHSWAILEFVYFNRFHLIVEYWDPVFDIFFWSFCNAKAVINVPFENFWPY